MRHVTSFKSQISPNRLVIEYRFVSRVQEQMVAFLDGLGALVPPGWLKIFDEHELELLLCGIQHIDVRDWRANSLYKGDYHANHLVVQWFWRVSARYSCHCHKPYFLNLWSVVWEPANLCDFNFK